MANSLDAYVPEWWAMESLAILRENMVVGNLVHRDFENQFQKYGDIVNTRRPSELKAVRKAKTTAIAAQDVSATNVPVPLDQHVTVAFNIHDLEQSYSFKNLVDEYLNPAGLALARNADRVILGQAARFIEAGKVLGTNLADTYDNLVDSKVFMDNNKAYEEGRNMIMSPTAHGKLLKNKQLFPVEKAGTGDVVHKGFLGQLANFNLYTAQNQMNTSVTTVSGKIGTALTSATIASVKGTSTITLAADSSLAVAANQSIVINGSPYTILSVAAGPPIVVTLTEPLREDVPVGSKVWNLIRARVAQSYAVGYVESMEFVNSAGRLDPSIGSVVKIGTQFYTIVETGAAANTYYLDRPLETAVTANDDLNMWQGIQTNFGFHRNALTAAIRPLAPVPAGAGVRSAVASFDGLTVRSTIGYNMSTQNLQVTLDFLMGVKVLDANLGMVMFS